ncbi:urease accessory protein UreD [Saccharobesus litoralis]|uniref:Urease accessory protein UreD n=1 Tax=Saccharobesus litoralis TaxID=2172099 RepID=A0A2S0VWS2_9ALTE|nr:urease accessory protein UreD [Saccharobesus litoralis]AWB68674.1 urease accessory protein UreD [Saccharobesus litoralis]
MSAAERLNMLNTQKSREWLAQLTLGFKGTAKRGTQLVKSQRRGPLTIQKAFYPEGKHCAHVYLLHPPAGIVSGDQLHIDISAENNAHTLITTPGANRFYQARTDKNIGDPRQLQHCTYQLQNNAIVESLPQETIVFRGAQATNKQDIYIDQTSVYLGWDINCLSENQQAFDTGSFTQQTRVYIDKQLKLHDRIAINQSNLLFSKNAGLAGHSVFATFVLAAPHALAQVATRQALQSQIRQRIEVLNADKLISITDVGGILLARYLGDQAEQAKALFYQIWQIARPVCCQQTATKPRIWYT